MRWTLRIIVVIVLLLLAYTAWPIMGLHRIASIIEQRNAAALNDAVDFPELRRSLSAQLVAAYLKATGKAGGAGQLENRLAVGIGTSIADPLIAQLVTPEALLDLLNSGKAGAGAGVAAPFSTDAFSTDTLSSAWQTWLNSEYSGTTYYVSLPPRTPAAQQFRVKLRVSDWQWKIAGVELPDELRARLVQELVKANPS